jgi:hypothetical protein
MTVLTKITKVETTLYLREPISVLLVLGLPLALLIVFGSIGTGRSRPTTASMPGSSRR